MSGTGSGGVNGGQVTDLLADGTAFQDDHRWMEDWTSPRFSGWIEEQARRSRTWLQARARRYRTLAEITAITSPVVDLTNVQAAAGWLYFLRRTATDQTPVLVRLAVGAAEPEVVLDTAGLPDAMLRVLAPRSHVSIDWYTPSPTGHHVAVGLSVDGSEDTTLMVVGPDGALVDGFTVPRAYAMRLNRANVGGATWTTGGDAVGYLRLRELDDQAATGRYQDAAVCLRRLAAPTREVVLARRGWNPHLPLAPDDLPMVTFVDHGRAVLTVAHASQAERSVHVVDDALAADTKALEWRALCHPGDRITAWCVQGDHWYGGVACGAGWAIRNVCLAGPQPHDRGVIAECADSALEDLLIVGDTLVVRAIRDGCGELYAVTPGPAGPRRIAAVPPRSGIAGAVASPIGPPPPERAAVTILSTSWIAGPRLLSLALDGGAAVSRWPTTRPADEPPTGADGDRCTGPGLDPAEPWHVEAVRVVASDGVEVPVTLLAGVRAAGPAQPRPLWLVGYGFFGITLRPQFTPLFLAWLRRGGIVAIAHVRGGGDRGEAWYRAGHLANKERTFEDFLDVAADLVDRGLTRPDLMVAEGTSAGGLTAAGAMLRRPEQFAAVILRVPVTNTYRLEMHENGPPNIPEYGTVTTPDGARALGISDAYSRVRPDVDYPPVLLTVGLRDPRVLPWQPAKLAARLQQYRGGMGALLRVETHGGHGVGASARQSTSEAADRLGFALAITGEDKGGT